MKKFYFLAIFVCVSIFSSISSAVADDKPEVIWMSFEEAIFRAESEPRKILVDVYTNWCGWCKRMDADTYTNPVLVEYINKHYYAVKFNAETTDTIHFNNKFFVYKPEYKANELALSLLSQKMSYPTTVFLAEDFSMLTPVAGYMKADQMERVVKYFGENAHKSKKYDEFMKDFIGEVK